MDIFTHRFHERWPFDRALNAQTPIMSESELIDITLPHQFQVALALDKNVGAIIHSNRIKNELSFVKLSQPCVLKVAVWVLLN